MQNTKLEHYLIGPHTFPHKFFAFIYILIDIDWLWMPCHKVVYRISSVYLVHSCSEATKRDNNSICRGNALIVMALLILVFYL